MASRAGLFACWSPIALTLACIGFIQSAASLLQAREKGAADSGQVQTVRPEYLNSAPGVLYLGSKACASCHPQIYEEYRRTDMGRSFAEASATSLPNGVPSRFETLDPGSNLYFQVSRRGQGLFQTVYGSDATGKETFRRTEKIEYSMGSGVNGIGYLIRKGNFLFQAPLAYYTKTNGWGLAPGYRGHDVGFSRAINARCITCHSGRPQPVANRNGFYKDPPFQELSIDI